MTPNRRFLAVAYAEGASFLVLLFIAMPLKYLAGMPMAVRVTGTVHGALFVLYVILVFVELLARRFDVRAAAIALLASVLPFGPFVLTHRMQSS